MRKTSTAGALIAAALLAACTKPATISKPLASEGEFHMAGQIPGIKPIIGDYAIQTTRSAGENGLAKAVAFCAIDEADSYTVSLFRGNQCIFRDIPARYVMKSTECELKTGDLLWWNRIEKPTTQTSEDPGEIYIMGHVMRPGVYSIASPMTIKQAILGANDEFVLLGLLRKVELIRRIGENEETTQEYKIGELIRGDIVDLQLAPNDILNVGTDFKTICLPIPPRDQLSGETKRRAISTDLHFAQLCLPQYDAEISRLETQRDALLKIAGHANARAVGAVTAGVEYFQHQIKKIRTARDHLKTQIHDQEIEIKKLAQIP